MLAFTLQQVKTIKLNCAQPQGYILAGGYVSPIKTLDPDYLTPKQFSKLDKGSGDFGCARISFLLDSLLLCLHLCLRRY